MVRISARIPATGRDALRRLAAAHGLSVAPLIDLSSAAAADHDAARIAVVTSAPTVANGVARDDAATAVANIC